MKDDDDGDRKFRWNSTKNENGVTLTHALSIMRIFVLGIGYHSGHDLYSVSWAYFERNELKTWVNIINMENV